MYKATSSFFCMITLNTTSFKYIASRTVIVLMSGPSCPFEEYSCAVINIIKAE